MLLSGGMDGRASRGAARTRLSKIGLAAYWRSSKLKLKLTKV
jgi:hypothetical protein